MVFQHYPLILAYDRHISIDVNVPCLFLRPEENALISDLKWCYHVVCPAEGSLLISALKCTDVKNKMHRIVRYPALITYLCQSIC